MKIVLIIALVLASLHAEVKHFKSTKEAVNSFILALEQGNRESLTDMLTAKYQEIITHKELSADDLRHFLNTYERAHRFTSFDGKSVYLEVGKQGWTFPIPLVKNQKGWYFDIDIGIENMITREIGRNELEMIEALRAQRNIQDLQKLIAFKVFRDKDYIVALPKDYHQTAIMSFVLDKDGNIYEANLQEKEYSFDNRFKKISKDNWID